MRPHLKAAYDDFDEESTATGLECKDPSRTQQHDEPDANINNIVAKYLRTGQLERHTMPPLQGDFTNAPDMQTAMNLGVAAKDAFMEQPAAVRARFNNDPAEFVQFCSDPNNKADMKKLGLLSVEAVERMDNEALAKERQAAADRADAEAFRRGQNAPKS